jgi:hypothetical protein
MKKTIIHDLETKTVALVEDADIPITADYVSKELRIAWDTARSLLLGLACQGRIHALKTMKSWVFLPCETNACASDRGPTKNSLRGMSI